MYYDVRFVVSVSKQLLQHICYDDNYVSCLPLSTFPGIFEPRAVLHSLGYKTTLIACDYGERSSLVRILTLHTELGW